MADALQQKQYWLPADELTGPAAGGDREALLAVTAGFLGWTLDAFDFFLVVIALPQSPPNST